MVDLEDHVFPLKKYRLIYEKLLSMGAKKENFIFSEPALEEDLLRVHTSKYLKKLQTGKLSHSEILAMELPYTPEVLDFSTLHVGGTIKAAEEALKDGISIHIGGGFHHAFADHGEGFCVLNDVAISLEKLIQENKIDKVMVVDCDVHQGNGTASILSKKDYAYTFSIHQMDLYPSQKQSSSIDIGLWSGDGDEKYISELNSHFPRIYGEFQPDLIFYLAGADPYEKDQLGGLHLTMDGLMERDRIVLSQAQKLKLPVVIVFAGGYAYDVMDTVAIHLNTIIMAKKVFSRM
jgi:acetoin utilization deacetylase AcuC-like enzyme